MLSCRPGSDGQLHRLEVEVELTDDRVAQPLAAGPVEPHVLGGPALPEQLTAGRQFADQRDQLLVVRIAARLQAQHRGRVPGDLVVVDEELLGRLGIQVDEPGGVRRSARIGEHRRVQRPGELVHREHVVAAVADPGRGVGDGVEHLLQRRANRRRCPAACVGVFP